MIIGVIFGAVLVQATITRIDKVNRPAIDKDVDDMLVPAAPISARRKAKEEQFVPWSDRPITGPQSLTPTTKPVPAPSAFPPRSTR